MARKGEKSKARKSPDKSPRRVGRPSRRRKKSDSESSEDKKPAETAQVEQSQPGESGEGMRMRRSSRRQPEPSTSEPKPQAAEWKEDESFWAKEDTDPKTETGGEGGTVWKVQTSNGSGGEIQKLRICRQRPGGAGSDSADSSMSPAKESSPLHKRALRKESQKSPLVESNVGEIDLPPSSDAGESSQPPNQASDAKPTVAKVVEYIYETQPSVPRPEVPSPKVTLKETPRPKVKSPSPVPEQVVEEPPSRESNLPSPQDSPPSQPLQTEQLNSPSVEDQAGENAKTVEVQKPEADLVKIQDKTEDPPDVKQSDSEPTPPKAEETKSQPSPQKENPESDKQQDSSRPTTGESGSLEVRRKSDGSVKSGGSRRSSVSGPTSEYNEPLLEISVNKSPIQEGKEEGEIVEDEKDTPRQGRVINIRTKQQDPPPSRVSRRSTDSTSNSPEKPGSAPSTPATTAKKHPLITGPEPDDWPAARRRKVSGLGAGRTVITAGGATRPVRSIPGEALKAVLHPEADKKEKEKRPKTVRVKEERVESGGGEQMSSLESKLNQVEDIREILQSNRAAEKRQGGAEVVPRASKSPTKTRTQPTENKAPARKVSIGAGPLVQEVKAAKPSRSKSPGDSKATPILFITNLVRPFTAGQLKELLARTGTIVQNGFFIDKIKSKCFVKYADAEMAIETRHALNGVRWPVSNPKVLKVSYALEKELKVIQESAEGEVVDDISTPRSSGSSWLSSEQAVNKDKEKRKTSGPSTREWDRGKMKTGSDGDVILVEEYPKEDKGRGPSLADMERNDKGRDKDKPLREQHSRNHSERLDRGERRKRPSTPPRIHHSPPPARKFKKKDYDAPAKLLDDLFRKTKTSPCLYWLPLSAEQIAEKEEARRKHMAEHERRMAELKKSTQQRRDKERDRDRDRRRK